MPRRPRSSWPSCSSPSQPACVGSTDRKPISVSGCAGDVAGDVPVIDPQAAEPRLAAEDDRPDVWRRRGPVVLVTHGQIDLDAALAPLRLLAEVAGEVARVFPDVAVDVDDHQVSPSFAVSGGSGNGVKRYIHHEIPASTSTTTYTSKMGSHAARPLSPSDCSW